ncbi:unnamed protein product [Musa acuminata subsp. burmannicoides]
MSGSVDAAGEPIPTSAVLMAAAKHIATRCRAENVAFIKCKKKDPNPEKCLDKGRHVTSCVLNSVLNFCYPMIHWDQQEISLNNLYEQSCVVSAMAVLCKDAQLHYNCPKEMDAYAGCMYYYTNEFDLCRKEQEAIEKACPVSE